VSKKLISLMGILLSLVLVMAMTGCAAPAAPAAPTGPTEVKPVTISLYALEKLNTIKHTLYEPQDTAVYKVVVEVSNPNDEWVEVDNLTVEVRAEDGSTGSGGGPGGTILITGSVPTFYIPAGGVLVTEYTSTIDWYGNAVKSYLTRGWCGPDIPGYDTCGERVEPGFFGKISKAVDNGSIAAAIELFDKLEAQEYVYAVEASASCWLPEFPDAGSKYSSLIVSYTYEAPPLE